MSDNIQTAYHRAFEAAKRGQMTFTQRHSRDMGLMVEVTKSQLLPVEVRNFFEYAMPTPKFAFDQQSIEMLKSPDALASIEAMYRANVIKLPYPTCFVEWKEARPLKSGARCTNMVVIAERSATMLRQMAGEDVYHPYLAMICRFIDSPTTGDLVMLAPTNLLIGFVPDAGPEKSFGIHYAAFEAPYVRDPNDPRVKQMVQEDLDMDVGAADTALSALTLLLNTRGIHKEVITPTRLNKKRQGSGKVAIPSHTFIRLGHVYDRSGLQIKLDPNSRKPVRVHWRRGHTKQVVYGQGRKLRKLQYIEPCLVNYSEGGDKPVPSVKVRW